MNFSKSSSNAYDYAKNRKASTEQILYQGLFLPGLPPDKSLCYLEMLSALMLYYSFEKVIVRWATYKRVDKFPWFDRGHTGRGRPSAVNVLTTETKSLISQCILVRKSRVIAYVMVLPRFADPCSSLGDKVVSETTSTGRVWI